MRRSVLIRTCLMAVLAALMLVGGVPVAQSGEFNRQDGPDFDCDGVPDGAVAAFSDQVSGRNGAGSVTVTYGASGRSQEITQASAGVPDSPETEDNFGASYAWYDRNRDGCDDLVVGAPGEGVGSEGSAGAVTLIPGSRAGLNTGASVRYTQDSTGFPDSVEEGDAFGAALAAGRTSQGTPYLLIGSPGESGPDIWTLSSGSVYYVRGSSISVINQDTPGVSGAREFDEFFGESLAASERFFVVGTPWETVGSASFAGMVHVFSHTLTGGRPTPIGAFHQNTTGISDTAEEFDTFGISLSVLSYQPTSGHPIGALVAVGSPDETVGAADAAGMVHLVYVSPQGAVRQQAAVTQNTAGVTGAAEEADRFGADVVLANRHPASNVATPATLAWAVAADQEVVAGGGLSGVHAFRPGWRPGQPDIFLREGALGIETMDQIDQLRGSHTRLFMGARGESCLTVGWPDLLDGGALQSELRPFDDCG